MSCMFRAIGKEFDVDGFLRNSPWRPETVFRLGESKYPPRTGELRKNSGFNLVVSETELDDFEVQLAAAQLFLHNNRDEIRRLNTYATLEGVCLDFAVEFTEEKPARFFNFPMEIVSAAGALGLSLEISVYAVAAEPDA